MVTSLRRTCSSSEINLVPGGVEVSSTHLEYISHPLGSDDARARYKRLKQIKVKSGYHPISGAYLGGGGVLWVL